jgi:hypothetical protein
MRALFKTLIFAFSSLLANAEDSNPLEKWEFVAVIARSKDGDVSITILKDSAERFSDKKSIAILRDRFKSKEPAGPAGWIYSMSFTGEKRSDQILSIGEKFTSEMQRNLLPFISGPGTNGPPQPQKKDK